MEEELRQFLNNWIDPNKRSEDLLKDIYSRVFNKSIDKCPRCKAKAINDLQRYLELTYGPAKPLPMGNRKYLLKPGNHQFVSGGEAIHNNENTNDTILAAYLKAYPYIRPLFLKIPE